MCRAGYKLEKALDHYKLDVKGRVAMDAGLSTGGFTDCLLQRGARRVYGVDVGYGQVAGRLRSEADGNGASSGGDASQPPRLAILERTNLRHLKPEDLEGCWAFDAALEGEADPATAAAEAPSPPPPRDHPPPVSLVTLDLSFISVLKVLPAVVGVLIAGRRELRRQQALLREGNVVERRGVVEAAGDGLPPPPTQSLLDALPPPAVVVLIKPQFEAGRKQVGSGGVVRDPAVHHAVIDKVTAAMARCGLVLREEEGGGGEGVAGCGGVIESPLRGDKGGNVEFLGLFVAVGEEDDAGLSMEGAMEVAGVGAAVAGAEEDDEDAGEKNGRAVGGRRRTP